MERLRKETEEKGIIPYNQAGFRKRMGSGYCDKGEEIVYALAYANGVVLIAEEDEIRSMMERLREHLEKKRLVLNTRKRKIMRFRKGEERKLI
ncbi:hypothetical protein X777_01114 [Ooceraea biroi]|uniref:Reverse transcriptase domain-containing protein n=1 Tax=Ooceraea biroi TaxID=2015173 RepID=A0A026WR89_OOCBI|nr:hypothetical protein X777_01114 [Ooceraea biroi]